MIVSEDHTVPEYQHIYFSSKKTGHRLLRRADDRLVHIKTRISNTRGMFDPVKPLLLYGGNQFSVKQRIPQRM
jgi:hypothetical protein